MVKSDRRAWWIAAGLSGLISGIFGPLIGSIIVFGADLVHHRTSSLGDLFKSLLELFGGAWLFAVILFGLPGFIFGCCGGLLLKLFAAKCRSGKGVIVLGAILGLALGSAAPLSLMVYGLVGYGYSWSLPIGYIPLGAVSGAACGVVMTWLLRSRRLLELSAHQTNI